jgi:hypothetical protein
MLILKSAENCRPLRDQDAPFCSKFAQDTTAQMARPGFFDATCGG